MAQYLVERYVPGRSPAEVEAEAQRLALAAAGLAETGESIEYLGSVFVPEEESYFSHFSSGSIGAVHAACARAELTGSRVVEAIGYGGVAP
jgi:hypothetical protein